MNDSETLNDARGAVGHDASASAAGASSPPPPPGGGPPPPPRRRRWFNKLLELGLLLLILLTIYALGRSLWLGDFNTSGYIFWALVFLLLIYGGVINPYVYLIGGWVVTSLAVAFAWLYFGGSYHHRLDYLLLPAVFLLVAWAMFRLVSGQSVLSWAAKVLTFLAEPMRVMARRILGRTVDTSRLASPPPHPLHGQWGFVFCVVFLFFFWFAASTLDWALVRLGAKTQPRDMTRFARLPARAAYPELKVGAALSGGGFRAALVHAGVLNAFDHLGVPVTHIASVSGGSIIGAFYAAGGEPHHFRDAVADNRFNLAREVTGLWNAARLVSPARLPNTATTLLPTAEFERTDVQANLLDSILLDGVTFADLEHLHTPRLMICTTDLYSGSTVGLSKQGVVRRFMVRPGEKAAFVNLQPPQQEKTYDYVPAHEGFPFREPVARLVAASGAFPGAFNGVAAEMVLEPGGVPQQVMLADGGISDNTALSVMNFAPPGDDWALDLSVASDASALFRERQSLPVLGELTRAIDIVYASAGGRPDDGSASSRQLLVTPGKYIDRRGGRNDDAIVKDVKDAVAAADETTLRLLLNVVGDAPAVTAEAVAADEGARWQLAARVADELKRGLDTFMTTPTLKDHFEGRTAGQLFRLGQLLVALEWPAIKRELDQAQSSSQSRQREQLRQEQLPQRQQRPGQR